MFIGNVKLPLQNCPWVVYGDGMILRQATEFLSLLLNDLDRYQIYLEPHWDIDHLCYRVPTEERYQELKNVFSAFAELLIESPVNGRLISTYKLDVPIVFHDWMIDLIELPAPKPGKSAPEGFEHIEVVCDTPFSELQQKYKHLNLDVGGLGKLLNQELEIVLGERNIKFHHLSLQSVIWFEARGNVWPAEMESPTFFIQEKLLKYGGAELRRRVSALRQNGMKTEPAFGKALGLGSDPSAELLRLQTLSIAELRATLET